MKLNLLTITILSAFSISAVAEDMLIAGNDKMLIASNGDMLVANNEKIAAARLAALNTAFLEDLALTGSSNLQNSDFSRLLSFRKKNITIKVIGESKTFKTQGQVSLNGVVIKPTKDLYKYFVNLGITPQKSTLLEQRLSAGITSTPCEGNRTTCVVSSPELSFVNDYYNNTLRIFVPLDFYSKVVKSKEYLKPKSRNLLSNKFNVNISKYDDLSYFINNTSYLGFGQGYFKSEFYASQYNNYFNSGYYKWYNKDISQSFGLSNYAGDINIAGSLSNLNSANFIGYTIGNSRDLELIKRSNQYAYYLAPSDGILVVERNDKVILRRSIKAGKGQINYNDLPLGVYNITINVLKDDKNIYSIKQLVMNSPEDGYLANSWFFRTGYLAKQSLFLPDNSFLGLAELGFNTPIYEQLNLFMNVAYTQQAIIGQVGIGYQGNDWRTQLSYNGNLDVQNYKLELSSGSLNLTANKYTTAKDTNDDLFIYQSVNAKNGWDATLGYSQSLFDNLFLVTSFYYNETKSDLYSFKNYGLNNNLNYSFSNGVSISLQQQLSSSENQWGFNISFPLGSNVYVNGSVMGDTYYSSVSYNRSLNDSLSFSSGLNYNKYGQQATTSENVGLSYNDSYISAYGQLTNNKDKISYSADFSTNLLTTFQDYLFTNRSDSNSLLIINSSEQLAKNKANNINITDVESEYSQSKQIKDQLLLPFSGFSRQKIGLQLVENGYYVKNYDQVNDSYYDLIPGKAELININARNASQIFVVSPKGGSEISCEGNGCVKSNDLSSTIQKFLVKPYIPFKIKSGNKVCFSGSLGLNKTETVVCE